MSNRRRIEHAIVVVVLGAGVHIGRARAQTPVAAATAAPAPAVAAGEKGFTLESPDGRYQVKVRGLLHADGRFFLDDAELGKRDTVGSPGTELEFAL